MDQEKQIGELSLTARSTNWNEFITFLTDDIFDAEICDFIRNHRYSLKAPTENEAVLDVQIEDWEWRLFDTYKAVLDYLKDKGPYLPQNQEKGFSRTARALCDLFWSVIKLKRPVLWRSDNLGIRIDESGRRVLVGFNDNSMEGMSFGPFKIMGPFGPQE